MAIEERRDSRRRDPARAWHTRAEDLAAWVRERLVNRTGRDGKYVIEDDGKVGQRTGWNLTIDRLVRHFRANDATDVIGTHTGSAGEPPTSSYVAIDVDAHPGRPCDPEANRAFALHVHRRAG